MFGLTYREQRWKAEQKAAETLVAMTVALGEAAAKVRIAEAQSRSVELEAMRAELTALKALLSAPSSERTASDPGCPPDSAAKSAESPQDPV